MPYTCPVCGYKDLPSPPRDYEICPSCGTEFEYHDARRGHAELRERWVQNGAIWHSRVVNRPVGWNPWLQLLRAGLGFSVPRFSVDMRLQSGPIILLNKLDGARNPENLVELSC